jgi:hypothetical protein
VINSTYLAHTDRFVFATATVPQQKPRSRLTEWFSKVLSFGKGASGGEQGKILPISMLASRGWQSRDGVWDHTRLKWYHPVWPRLDYNLDHLSDKSTGWILDWKQEGESMTMEGSTLSSPSVTGEAR